MTLDTGKLNPNKHRLNETWSRRVYKSTHVHISFYCVSRAECCQHDCVHFDITFTLQFGATPQRTRAIEAKNRRLSFKTQKIKRPALLLSVEGTGYMMPHFKLTSYEYIKKTTKKHSAWHVDGKQLLQCDHKSASKTNKQEIRPTCGCCHLNVTKVNDPFQSTPKQHRDVTCARLSPSQGRNVVKCREERTEITAVAASLRARVVGAST
jgi:hypothetical protein